MYMNIYIYTYTHTHILLIIIKLKFEKMVARHLLHVGSEIDDVPERIAHVIKIRIHIYLHTHTYIYIVWFLSFHTYIYIVWFLSFTCSSKRRSRATFCTWAVKSMLFQSELNILYIYKYTNISSHTHKYDYIIIYL